MNNKEKFIALFRCWIKRPGAENLLEWLESTDFFEAPASTRYHGNYPGGLVEHSLNVCRELAASSTNTANTESTVICALLHDVCKTDFYVDMQDSQWPAYRVRNCFPLGHGEKSLYLIARFMPLTNEEALAIRWHMGKYDDAAQGRDYYAAMDCRLVRELCAADMRATQKEQEGMVKNAI